MCLFSEKTKNTLLLHEALEPWVRMQKRDKIRSERIIFLVVEQQLTINLTIGGYDAPDATRGDKEWGVLWLPYTLSLPVSSHQNTLVKYQEGRGGASHPAVEKPEHPACSSRDSDSDDGGHAPNQRTNDDAWDADVGRR